MDTSILLVKYVLLMNEYKTIRELLMSKINVDTMIFIYSIFIYLLYLVQFYCYTNSIQFRQFQNVQFNDLRRDEKNTDTTCC